MTSLFVLAGGPCTGKTTTLDKLRARNNPSFRFISEIATIYIEQQQALGIDPSANLVEFEKAVLAMHIAEESKTRQEGGCVVLDRSLICSLAITEMKKISEEIAGKMLEAAKKLKYTKVYILDPVPFVPSKHRLQTSAQQALEEHEWIKKTYEKYQKELGYEIVYVPVLPPDERTDFIEADMKATMLQQAAKAIRPRAPFFEPLYQAPKPASTVTRDDVAKRFT